MAQSGPSVDHRLRRLLEDKRTRYTRREFFRVWPDSDFPRCLLDHGCRTSSGPQVLPDTPGLPEESVRTESETRSGISEIRPNPAQVEPIHGRMVFLRAYEGSLERLDGHLRNFRRTII